MFFGYVKKDINRNLDFYVKAIILLLTFSSHLSQHREQHIIIYMLRMARRKYNKKNKKASPKVGIKKIDKKQDNKITKVRQKSARLIRKRYNNNLLPEKKLPKFIENEKDDKVANRVKDGVKCGNNIGITCPICLCSIINKKKLPCSHMCKYFINIQLICMYSINMYAFNLYLYAIFNVNINSMYVCNKSKKSDNELLTDCEECIEQWIKTQICTFKNLGFRSNIENASICCPYCKWTSVYKQIRVLVPKACIMDTIDLTNL